MQRYIDMRNEGTGVYTITNQRTNRIYVGSTSSFSRRWFEHKEQLSKGTHANYKLQADWNLYGADAFVFAILERCHPTLRLDREQFYITRYQAHLTGYNILQFTRPAGERQGGRARPAMSARSAIRNLRKKQLG